MLYEQWMHARVVVENSTAISLLEADDSLRKTLEPSLFILEIIFYSSRLFISKIGRWFAFWDGRNRNKFILPIKLVYSKME